LTPLVNHPLLLVATIISLPELQESLGICPRKIITPVTLLYCPMAKLKRTGKTLRNLRWAVVEVPQVMMKDLQVIMEIPQVMRKAPKILQRTQSFLTMMTPPVETVCCYQYSTIHSS
jgi:hypothetical protein